MSDQPSDEDPSINLGIRAKRTTPWSYYHVLDALLTQTWDANRRAKDLSGPDRWQAYRHKGLLLSQAIELSSQGFRVLSFVDGIVGLQTPTGARFHLPLQDFSPAAKLLLARQLLQQLVAERRCA